MGEWLHPYPSPRVRVRGEARRKAQCPRSRIAAPGRGPLNHARATHRPEPSPDGGEMSERAAVKAGQRTPQPVPSSQCPGGSAAKRDPSRSLPAAQPLWTGPRTDARAPHTGQRRAGDSRERAVGARRGSADAHTSVPSPRPPSPRAPGRRESQSDPPPVVATAPGRGPLNHAGATHRLEPSPATAGEGRVRALRLGGCSYQCAPHQRPFSPCPGRRERHADRPRSRSRAWPRASEPRPGNTHHAEPSPATAGEGRVRALRLGGCSYWCAPHPRPFSPCPGRRERLADRPRSRSRAWPRASEPRQGNTPPRTLARDSGRGQGEGVEARRMLIPVRPSSPALLPVSGEKGEACANSVLHGTTQRNSQPPSAKPDSVVGQRFGPPWRRMV